MSKYEKFSREDLIALAEKQDSELASKKYGLVWDSEREPEQVVFDCEHNLPILKRINKKEIKTDKNEDNILIEGDNYHALTVLNYTHQEKIDVIYIDPPYNTGNKSWKYNNNYVEPEDGYYHSKWLNMMEKRLNIAKKLLKEDGVLICAIDENEFANLYLLLSKVFPNYKLDQVVIVHNPRGVQSKNFSYNHEYALFVYPNDGKEYIGNIERNVHLTEELRDHGGESLRTDAKNCFYPIITDGKEIIEIGDVPIVNFHPKSKNTKLKNGLIAIWPIDITGIERKWVFARDTVSEILGNLKITRRSDGLLDVLRTKTEQKPRTVWVDQKYDASTYGSKVVRQITNMDFPYPKSLLTVQDCLSVVAKKKKSAVVLDFFAGSGTTGHAVLELNKQDVGNRKFILCTNNENNICEQVTYPRLQKVIKGYKKNGDGEKIEGLGGNLQYFRTALIKDTKNKDQMRVDLTEKCTEMLCVKENIFNLEKETDDYKIFSSNKCNKFLCVYYNFYDDSFHGFLKEIKKLNGEKKIYMFSMDGKVRKSLFVGVRDFEIEEIPQKIIDVYKQLVKMNISVKADVIFLEFDKANKKVFTDKDKDKDGGAQSLRIVLEKTIQKIAQKNGVSIFKENSKEERISVLNDMLKSIKVFTHVQWEENKTYLVIGNHASHGDYSEYDLRQVEQFYRHIQELLNVFNI
ncbi:MAG: hypothetical protein A3C08_00295 [Candidatus Taylorbacteria bacterium RIFCSPHIGHO2_02_FULL_47_18]|uniref:DNA methylase N-4/N-6 domain-containing protein n=1 Tax=Candidatus Taylorbacteria bacterium RIFCSPLOWO2_01_FULL_48_100 TaxID=1802322 RepID=A0A1G2NG65_9BACT|nr:MAG: hypothetical protein A3C08_00295 [Candidatus Taylorbacteria bacterium RIFCSPHIGHO2_02_FULL_47_18]OHA34459.1 MAG: hypothetical protein A2938_01280 [Candidatus Taylorbacteria bacterium RIFCSPLOWO2_01_FULL_48_100]OHA40113.1 MAG: hypothetical protein A3J31_00800 [Candidatus Taylorbacteria bacterium RIFCSPLOWO2_02_FULL_48_16]OHA45552.1 MAG: hypothetical protein A3H13_02045 [Candidatus Taylorbacteria bacterium RIFCSPLOWO2_12_FULL_48_11]